MNIAAISRFLNSIMAVGSTVFGKRLAQTHWQILIVLGGAGEFSVSGQFIEGMPAGAQSYKYIKCLSGLSDDALSRGLRRLVEMGLVERHTTGLDQRVVCYKLTARAEDGLAKVGRMLVTEMGSLILSMASAEGPTAAEDRAAATDQA